MKKYRIVYKSGSYVEAEIEAKSTEEAIDIAEKMDGGDFDEISNSYIWELDKVIELK